MSNTQPPASPPAGEPSSLPPLIQAVLKNRAAFRGVLFAVAVAFLGFVLVRVLQVGRSGFNTTWVWAIAMGLVALAVALFDLVKRDDDPTLVRLELMVLGGALGLATALYGIGLWVFTHRETITGGFEKWAENRGAVLYPGLALIGGLALMFLSVQLVRGMERQNQSLRRIVYGYNVVLTSLLLLAILAIPNVLAYAEPFTRFFGRPYDWTQTNVNSISPQLQNMLADLKQPVKAYVLMPRGTILAQDSISLLDNCRSISPKFTWELMDPRSREKREDMLNLMQRYNIADPAGILLVVQNEADSKAKPEFAFIKDTELRDEVRGGRGGPLSYTFLGENALLKSLQSLLEGKLVVYFTQGHGELKLDSAPSMRMPAARREGAGSISTLRSRLTDRKGVDVKPLTFDATTKAVPDDAGVVVIARPTLPFGKAEVEALRSYVRRQSVTKKPKDGKDATEKEEEVVTAGKLIVLLDPIMQKVGDNTTLQRSGLEEFLAENNVRLGMNRVLCPNIRPPTGVICWTVRDSTNPIARAFHPSPPTPPEQFELLDVRTVDTLDEKSPNKVVQRLMETIPHPDLPVWAETDFNRDPEAAAAALRKDPDLAEKRLSKVPLSVAVAVSDSGGAPPGMPRDMAHAGLGKETPSMVVFGTSSWITDEALGGRSGRTNVDLFNSCVSWVREKSSVGVTIPGKKRAEYDPNLPNPDAGKLLYLPLGLLLLSVIGLGLGVWVVRRR